MEFPLSTGALGQWGIRDNLDIPPGLGHRCVMGEKRPQYSLVNSLVGTGLLASFLGCGGASGTFPGTDASEPDVSIVSSGSSSSGLDNDTGATSSSGSSSSGGGSSDDAAMPPGDSGDDSPGEAGGVMMGSDSGDAKDAAREGGVSACAAICEGCCDSSGKCVTGGTITVCGKNGASCEDCSKNSCIVSSAPCCTTAGKCGCAVAGFVACE